jgi:hypothetical protein
MKNVFKSYLRKFVLVLFDDIIVYNGSEKEHTGHLKAILDLLVKHKLYVKRS